MRISATPPKSAIVVPFQLPPITTRRWVARRKAEVIAAVHAGMLSALEACRRYRLTPEEFLDYARLAIVNREHAKFVFTRHLSDALERIVQWGETLGLNRDDLSYLELSELTETLHTAILDDAEAHLRQIIARRKQEASRERSFRRISSLK